MVRADYIGGLRVCPGPAVVPSSVRPLTDVVARGAPASGHSLLHKWVPSAYFVAPVRGVSEGMSPPSLRSSAGRYKRVFERLPESNAATTMRELTECSLQELYSY